MHTTFALTDLNLALMWDPVYYCSSPEMLFGLML